MDGTYRFDGTYTTYLFGFLNSVCPQAGISLKETVDMVASNPESTQEEKETMKMHSETLKDTRAMAGSEDCLHLTVFTPRVNNSNMAAVVEYHFGKVCQKGIQNWVHF